jgi:hypothetical protein
MAYVPDWETLSRALKRIAHDGGDLEDLKADLCNAMGDRKIRVRAFLPDDDEDHPGRCFFSPTTLVVERRLKPSDFDWEESIPTKEWLAGEDDVNIGWERRKLALLEVRTADVFALSRRRDPRNVSEGQNVNAVEPPTQRISKNRESPTPRDKKDLEAAYLRRVQEFEGKTPPSRAEDEYWFDKEFGLSRKRAREYRCQLAPRDWKARGRRKIGLIGRN